jgi:hypothetical protein
MPKVLRIGQDGKVESGSAAGLPGLPGPECSRSPHPGVDSRGAAGGGGRAPAGGSGPGWSPICAPRRAPEVVRWGRQRGSVYLADQKLPIQVPRVRNRQAGVEVPLESYHRLQQPRGGG